VNLGMTAPLADTWGMHGDIGAGWMIGMMLVMVLFWGAIILGIVWVARGAFDGWRGGRRETPTEILERRFAEGAISVEDYHERPASRPRDEEDQREARGRVALARAL
jgi:putative membrane protein